VAAFVGAVGLLGCFAVPPKDERPIYLFAGRGRAWAMTDDPNGGNLPATYRPWSLKRTLERSDMRFMAGADREALAEVDAKGYSLSVVTATIRDPRL
jgi:hypothetical protein